jgi:hypothetical protein
MPYLLPECEYEWVPRVSQKDSPSVGTNFKKIAIQQPSAEERERNSAEDHNSSHKLLDEEGLRAMRLDHNYCNSVNSNRRKQNIHFSPYRQPRQQCVNYATTFKSSRPQRPTGFANAAGEEEYYADGRSTSPTAVTSMFNVLSEMDTNRKYRRQRQNLTHLKGKVAAICGNCHMRYFYTHRQLKKLIYWLSTETDTVLAPFFKCPVCSYYTRYGELA